jgi:hypothetical protein
MSAESFSLTVMRLKIVFGLLACAALFGCTRTVSAGADTSLAKQVVTDMAAGRFDDVHSHFDDVLDVNLPANQLAGLWQRFTAAKGTLLSQGAPTVGQRGRVTIVSIPVQMTKQPGLVRVFFDSDGKINGLYVLNPGTPSP